MSYLKYNVSLTQGQREKMLRSFQKKAPFTIRLKNSQLIGSDPLMLTQTQIKRIEKSRRNGTGTDLRISAVQMRKQDGGSLFSAILPMMSKVGAMALPWLSKAAAPLATGALSGLSSLGVNKLFGSGLFSIPQDKVDKLVKYKDYLTKAQKKQIFSALQSGAGIPRFQLTKSQHGGFLGTLLASIGVPLLLNALTGKGLQVDGPSGFRRRRNVYVPHPTPPKKPHSTTKSKGGLVLPYETPPFIGTWADYGKGLKKKRPRKKKGDGLLLGKDSPFNGIPLLGALL